MILKTLVLLERKNKRNQCYHIIWSTGHIIGSNFQIHVINALRSIYKTNGQKCLKSSLFYLVSL
jgi:hypothetical protein